MGFQYKRCNKIIWWILWILLEMAIFIFSMYWINNFEHRNKYNPDHLYYNGQQFSNSDYIDRSWNYFEDELLEHYAGYLLFIIYSGILV